MASKLLMVPMLAAFSLEAASAAPSQDREAILAQQGCYEVTFQFAETFALKDGYEPRAPYRVSAREWVTAVRSEENHLALQHVLVLPHGAMKHWRQDWVYEPQSIFNYQSGNTWQKEHLSLDQVEGMWAQKVFQVDDSPRYECVAPWIHWGDHHYWECQAWAPLPRREATQRSDYNILDRRNRHQITEDGWVHEVDSVKLAVDDAGETPLVREAGRNVYRRLPDDACSGAASWWQDQGPVWSLIQQVWEDVYSERDVLHFKEEVDGQTLWQQLFAFARAQSSRGDVDPDQVKAGARAIIDQYLID